MNRQFTENKTQVPNGKMHRLTNKQRIPFKTIFHRHEISKNRRTGQLKY